MAGGALTAKDSEEFAAIWRQVERQVLARIRRERDLLQRLGEDEDDVAHDVFVAMLEAYRRSGGISYPVTLAHKITSCKLTSRIRKRHSRPELVEWTEATEPAWAAIPSPSVEVEERETASEFAELRLLRLGRIEDRALALKEAGCSRTQIAGRLQMPEREVATTLQRARRKLTDARAEREARGLCALLAPVVGKLTGAAAGSVASGDRILAAAVQHAARCPHCRPHLVALRRAQLVAREVGVSEPVVVRLNGHERGSERLLRAA
jgi:RNA polymerase sigma factor (sigma-70 family)